MEQWSPSKNNEDSMLEEQQIDGQGYNYLRQQLAAGDDFANHLLDIPIEEGHITSYLPSDLSFTSMPDFKHSIFLTAGIKIRQDAYAKLQNQIAAHLRADERHCAIFETFGHRGDPWLAAAGLSYFFHKSKAYFFVTATDYDPQQIAKAIKSARNYPFVCSLTSLPYEGSDIQPSQEITELALRMLATKTDVMAVDAFDSETYLIWQRN
jgi:hypothetical protein